MEKENNVNRVFRVNFGSFLGKEKSDEKAECNVDGGFGNVLRRDKFCFLGVSMGM